MRETAWRKAASHIASPFHLMRFSLRAKLILIFGGLTTIPLGIVGIVSYSGSFSTIQENIIDSAAQLTLQLNTSIELVFKDSEKFLKIGNHERAIQFVNPYRQTEESTFRTSLELIELFGLFRNIYEFDTTIKGIYILGFNGNNISEQQGRFVLDRDLRSLPTIATILSAPGEVFRIPHSSVEYADSPGYTDVVSVGKAIVRPLTRDVLGVIIVDLDSAAIVELCGNVRMGESGYFTVVTQDGLFSYPPRGDTVFSGLDAASRQAILSGQEGYFVRRIQGQEELFVYNTLKGAGWKVIGRVKLRELMGGAYNIRNLTGVVVVLCLLFTVVLYFFISDALTHPLRDLKESMSLAESGNLDVRAETRNTDEIADLCHGFNGMIVKIKELMESNIREQEELKKSELKALQAQINPHFLYNTLDAIVWMTEANNREEVVRMTKTLSTFFRIVLSKGEEWIRVEDEVEHIRAYLTIQKMRYRDILEYDIEVDPALSPHKVLKLTLQPLVENAIYHGIKNRRAGGTIHIRGTKESGDSMRFEVRDNGIGMGAERLAIVRKGLDDDLTAPPHSGGYGLKNVNQRIKLYYGMKWGVSIESGEGVGTLVSIVLPTIG